jgi:hypothetical protein
MSRICGRPEDFSEENDRTGIVRESKLPKKISGQRASENQNQSGGGFHEGSRTLRTLPETRPRNNTLLPIIRYQ